MLSLYVISDVKIKPKGNFWSKQNLLWTLDLKSLANRSTLPPLPPEPGLGNWGVLGSVNWASHLVRLKKALAGILCSSGYIAPCVTPLLLYVPGQTNGNLE
jgi:hypothetical protein